MAPKAAGQAWDGPANSTWLGHLHLCTVDLAKGLPNVLSEKTRLVTGLRAPVMV